MAKVKGYYNTINGIFLGPVTAQDENGVAHTPRYVEGVCFGEYDTETDKFVPHTNPMIIPKGSTLTFDDDFNEKGQIVTNVTGIVEDKGADLTVKPGIRGFRTPNVETRDEKGRVFGDKVILSHKQTTVQQPSKTKPKGSKIREARPTKIEKSELPVVDWDKLFK